jgi:hypothetical protein
MLILAVWSLPLPLYGRREEPARFSAFGTDCALPCLLPPLQLGLFFSCTNPSLHPPVLHRHSPRLPGTVACCHCLFSSCFAKLLLPLPHSHYHIYSHQKSIALSLPPNKYQKYSSQKQKQKRLQSSSTLMMMMMRQAASDS